MTPVVLLFKLITTRTVFNSMELVWCQLYLQRWIRWEVSFHFMHQHHRVSIAQREEYIKNQIFGL